jgi:hypothetical protein
MRCRFLRAFSFVLLCTFLASILQAQSGKENISRPLTSNTSANYAKARSDWFYRGRIVHGKVSAELRRKAYEEKMRMRAQRATKMTNAAVRASETAGPTSLPWTPLGPVPLASDASGNGTQNYNQVAGRATAVAIDPADPSGNTVYIGGAQGGIWQSTNAANGTTNSVTWTAIADDQATLSIGAIAIQPGNTNPANSLILAATGEANNSADAYFGLGILLSTNAGGSWTLISTANGGALSFSGLGGARMAFSTASGQTSTVVAAMATTSEGVVDGAVTANTMRGLYTSVNAGQAWTYDALTDPGGADDATSATSVVYNLSAGLFFAAIRYHGFYSSPDGVNWTRLAIQPGGTALSTTACPPQSSSNSYACPIYRGEITVVPGRNEMYAWYVSVSSSGETVDGGIWQSLNGGASWNSISDSGIINCGDVDGCGVEQGTYNLELSAVPNGAGTDLYAGAINLYKCSINSENSACTSPSFINLTHAYGCDPIAAPAHVHPAQHALAFTIPTSGSDDGNDLMYFANDGGIYRALNGFTGLNDGSCSGTNQFDDLNQNLGSMTQFVTFSQHPSDANTLLGGAQGNGSPATGSATTSTAWGNVLGGDGAYNAIDPNVPTNFYASNPDVPPDGLGIELCSDGVSCVDSGFDFVVTSEDLGGDDGGFYFPYILDPQSTTAMLVGTCRVWRGPRLGGAYTVLSPNFDTLGSGTCTGSEVNIVQAIAVGGPTDPAGSGSLVVYATTSGYGTLNGLLYSPAGGNVWVTTDATSGPEDFSNVTGSGPQGSINPNQFPISSVAVDSSDPTGNTAYVTVMGFTGGTGHVWQTTSAGTSWTDFTANLPDSPVNAVVVDPVNAQVYVGTDVGVFVSSTVSANWTELGPIPSTDQSGFLPNVAVTALALFNSGGEELLRASTYGRGVWQYPIAAAAGYELAVSNSPLGDFEGQNAVFQGTANSVNGYDYSVALSCVAGNTPPPGTCTVSPASLTPGINTPFTVTVDGTNGVYDFNIQGVGSDPNNISQTVPVTLDVVSFALTTPTPSTVTVPRGTSSSPVGFEVTAAGSFNQSVTVSCSTVIAGAVCTLTPAAPVNPTASNPVNMSASVAVPASTAPGNYTVTIQATTAGAPATVTADFTLIVTTDTTFLLSEPSAFPEVNAGSTGTTGPINITSQDGFAGTVALSCPTTFGANSCSISPTSVSSFPATATLTINGNQFVAGAYSLTISGTSGSITQTVNVPFNVGDYSISGPQSVSVIGGQQATATLTLTSTHFYTGSVSATCNASALPGVQCDTSNPVSNPVTIPSDESKTVEVVIDVPNNAALGSYNITVNTQDISGEPSHSFTFAVIVTQDFSVTSETAIQTVTPGETTGAYALLIAPVGSSFNAPITLSCLGLPAGTQCSFSPTGPITPGSSPTDVVVSISTSSNAPLHRKAFHAPLPQRLTFRRAGFYLAGILAPGIVIMCVLGSGRKHEPMRGVALAMLALLAIAFLSCSGVSNSGGGGGGSCSSAPAVPAAPTATFSALTGSSPVTATLDWQAPAANSACTITEYFVYQNGSSTPVDTTPIPTYAPSLSPGSYSFTVAAQDSSGTSAPSDALEFGIYQITVTGTAPGTPSDSGQSAPVYLVVD